MDLVRGAFPLVLLVSVILSGCLVEGGPAAGETGSSDEAPQAALAAMAAVLRDCEHADLYLLVPVGVVAPYVPPEFTVPTAGVGPDGGPLALMFVGSLLCSAFEAGGFAGRGDFAWLDVAVRPVREELQGEADIFLLRLEHYALPGALQQAQASLQDIHLLASSIEVSLELTAPALRIEAPRTELLVQPALAGLVATEPFKGMRIREFGFATGGYTYIDLTVAPAAPTMGVMPATLQASDESLAAKILGPYVHGTLATAHFDFADVEMGYIPMT